MCNTRYLLYDTTSDEITYADIDSPIGKSVRAAPYKAIRWNMIFTTLISIYPLIGIWNE